MMDLSEFLLARIAEDEAVAHDWYAGDGVHIQDGSILDPARMLAECQSKRRIVGDVYPDLEKDNDALNYEFGGTSADPEDVLRLLATPYVSHSDYREEWRP